MSHILEVVIAAFIVGVAGALAGLALEKWARRWIAQGQFGRLWGSIGFLLVAAALVVVAGFYADSLSIHFIHRTISLPVPDPQLAGNKRISVPRVLSMPLAFLLLLFIPQLGRVTQTEHILSRWLENFSDVVIAISNAVIAVLSFRFGYISLHSGGRTKEQMIVAGLAALTFILSRAISAYGERISSARVSVIISVLWLGLTYSILTTAFII
jgi:hypothetical protein